MCFRLFLLQKFTPGGHSDFVFLKLKKQCTQGGGEACFGIALGGGNSPQFGAEMHSVHGGGGLGAYPPLNTVVIRARGLEAMRCQDSDTHRRQGR